MKGEQAWILGAGQLEEPALAAALLGLSGRVLVVVPAGSLESAALAAALPEDVRMTVLPLAAGAAEIAAFAKNRPRAWDAIVFAYCAGPIGPLDIGTWAQVLLCEGGALRIVDRLVPGTDAWFADPKTYVEPFLLATLERCGFDLRERSPAQGGSQGGQAPECLGFAPSSRRWRVSDARYADPAAMQRLFAAVFHHDISPEVWDWKYAEERGCGVIARTGDEIVAHYGCLRRRIRLRGTPAVALQVCDVMVSTPERGTLSRKGPFFMTAATAAEEFLLRHDVGFGFPNQRAMTVAERLGLYRMVDQLVSIHWSPGVQRPLMASRVRPLMLPRDEHIVEALWQAMAVDAGDYVIGVRDAEWVAQRYLTHPRGHYLAFLVRRRWSGEALGVVVLRPAEEGRCELLDVIGPFAAFPHLVAQARRICARLGGRELFCWISGHLAPLLAVSGGEVRPLDVCIPTSIWGAGPPVESLQNRWWLMGGDTDFR